MSSQKEVVQTLSNMECLNEISRFEKSRVSFEWKIKNFSRPCKNLKQIGKGFFCSSSFWCLMLYPNGHNVEDEGNVSIFLYNYSNKTEKSVEFKIYLEDKNGIAQYAPEAKQVFPAGRGFASGWATSIAKELLLGEKRADLLPDDVLTVFCEITIEKKIVKEVVKKSLEPIPKEKEDEDEDFRVPKATEILVGDMKAQLKNQKNCDVTLQVGEKAFPAHKFILGARSRVFAAMFEHDMEEKHTNVVTINDIEEKVMDDLLLYIYSANVKDLSVEKASGLYAAADKYDLCELKSQCRDFLLSHLSAGNACDVAVLADTHNDGLIIDSVKTFLRKNTFLLRSERWRNFAEQNLRLAYEITVAILFIEP